MVPQSTLRPAKGSDGAARCEISELGRLVASRAHIKRQIASGHMGVFYFIEIGARKGVQLVEALHSCHVLSLDSPHVLASEYTGPLYFCHFQLLEE